MTFEEFENSEDFELSDFLVDFDIDFNSDDKIETQFIKPKKHKSLSEEQLYFSNAEKIAKEINLQGNDEVFIIVNGNFIFGDFIEALFYDKQIYTDRLQISTLSLSYPNIISLRNLLTGNFVNNLDLIVSDYFFAHERQKLVKDIYENLNIDNRFQLAVVRNHTKIITFRTELGKHYVIHGSANLRSSNCIEQLQITDNEKLFNFVTKFNNNIIEEYKTIKGK